MMPQRQCVCSFGFPLLDAMTGGLEVGDLIVLLGATGTGKSTLGRHLINHWRHEGIHPFLLDMQQHASTAALQLAALASGVSPRDHLHEALSTEHAARVRDAAVADALGTVEIRSDGIRALAELHGWAADGAGEVGARLPGLLYIDELSGLANAYDKQATSQALMTLKSFAVRTGTPVVLLVSVPRDADVRLPWLDVLGPHVDKLLYTDSLIQTRVSTPHVTLIKNRKVSAVTSNVSIALKWSAELQTYRQA